MLQKESNIIDVDNQQSRYLLISEPLATVSLNVLLFVMTSDT